ncbi:MAG: cytochrome c biogenesis protein ResB [Candidatus Omnitrophica bacterium]|nr:cytochrome c biogenesis protein ResB [Candidatus Omnitrophota bacterium]
MSFSALQDHKSGWIVRIPYRIFKMAASLKLALFVLFSLMICLAAGTFVESAHGATASRLMVYDSIWFRALLFLLGLNVAAAALDRLPWKTKHVGFVITHLGIIIILIGSFVTREFMVDGQIMLAEGETESFITLPKPLLYIFSENSKKDWLIPIPEKPFAWQGKENLSDEKNAGLPLKMSILSNFPKARLQESWASASAGPSALKVTLHNSFMNETFWLVENDPTLGEIQAGPAKLKFTHELLKENTLSAAKTEYLEFQFEKNNVQIPLQEKTKLPAVFKLENTPYRVTLTRLFKNAVIRGRELIEKEAEGAAEKKDNPAAELILEGNGLQEKHTVFARYPDFPTMHGLKPSAAGAKIFYRFPDGGSRDETHELRFVKKDGELIYQIQSGMNIVSNKAMFSEEVATGWMDLKFRVEQYLPHAQRNRVFTPESNQAEGEEVFPALQLQLENESEKKTLWIGQGLREAVEMGENRYLFLYGQKRIPAEFRLKLKDFRVENYPGTSKPASFESDVILIDDMRGTTREANISMNEPLVHRGFRIYQSGYQQNQGQPEVSIFSVGRDPGVPIKYIGTIIMITGIILMFYIRRFSSNAGRIV